MDVRALQSRLTALGYSPGPEDGKAGALTYSALFCAVAGRRLGLTAHALGQGAAKAFPVYGIDSALRLAHWMGQMAHESGGFFYLKELGGPAYHSRMYDKDGRRPAVAARLGNVEQGDGARYCGRGIIQLTGRANYRDTGTRIGLDLEADPELAAEPHNAVLIACDYWAVRRVNTAADRDDMDAVTRAINGGLNGLADRAGYTSRAKKLLR